MSEQERKVGLGRVVEDQLSTGSPDPDDPGGTGERGEPTGASASERDRRPVEADSADSFPASDPPTWMSDAATPGAEIAGTAATDGSDGSDAQPS